MRLALCEGCKRHVRSDSSDCPFCGAKVTAPPDRGGLWPRVSYGRAAFLVLTAGAGTGSLACGDDEPDEVAEVAIPVYGLAIDGGAPDAETGDGAAPRPDAGDDAGESAVAIYGAPITADPVEHHQNPTTPNEAGASSES